MKGLLEIAVVKRERDRLVQQIQRHRRAELIISTKLSGIKRRISETFNFRTARFRTETLCRVIIKGHSIFWPKEFKAENGVSARTISELFC